MAFYRRWNDRMDAMLWKEWLEGHSSESIAQSLLNAFPCSEVVITKNAVIGRAHRLKLPGRPSPILKRKEAAA